MVGKLWLPVPRRGILQKGKYRLIDDYSAFSINALVTSPNKLDLMGVDEITGMIRAWHLLIKTALRDSSWGKQVEKLAGSTLDLKAAYKNFAVVPAHRCYAVCIVWNPVQRRVERRISYALGFGAGANVYSANRVFRAIHELLLQLLWVPCGNFFDDYPVVEPEATAQHGIESASRLLALLGFQVKEREEAVQPEPVFDACGVSFDMRDPAVLKIANKLGRAEGISAEAKSLSNEFSNKAPVWPTALASLAGRFRYARAQCMGKCGAAALWEIGQQMHKQGGKVLGTHALSEALEWIVTYLECAAPRRLKMLHYERPTFLFTDGAVEGANHETVTCGAVIFSPRLWRPQAFGLAIPDHIVRGWQSGNKRQTIAQAELAPALLARLTWGEALKECEVVHYIDNEGSKFSLIKGYSPSLACSRLLGSIWQEEARLGSLTWFDRVPSPSNIADGPSRLDFSNPVLEYITAVVPASWVL